MSETRWRSYVPEYRSLLAGEIGVDGCAAFPRGSSLMPLRHPHQSSLSGFCLNDGSRW